MATVMALLLLFCGLHSGMFEHLAFIKRVSQSNICMPKTNKMLSVCI